MGTQDLGTVWKDQKQLRRGYTTGSCSAAAAKAAAGMLLGKEELKTVSLKTPAGITLYLEVEEIRRTETTVSCAIRKDSGDDPDVTNGALVFATVSMEKPEFQENLEKMEHPVETETAPGEKVASEENDTSEVKDRNWFEDARGLYLSGGEGVGRVTRKGLEQKPGQAAINRIPREMIFSAVAEQKERYHFQDPLYIEISVPKGAEIAEKTFNPRLGIEGGISILGTSGIVEPMSEKALLDTILLEMKMLRDRGHRYCYVVPGNYGSDFLTEQLDYDPALAVKCSNYIGDTLDLAVQLEMKGILLVGHIGKLVKVAAGVMNTHSRQADCRMEVLASHGAMAGLNREQVRKIMNCITTTEALDILRDAGVLEFVMESVMGKMEQALIHRAGKNLQLGVIMFSEGEILGQAGKVEKILEEINLEEKLIAETSSEKTNESDG